MSSGVGRCSTRRAHRRRVGRGRPKRHRRQRRRGHLHGPRCLDGDRGQPHRHRHHGSLLGNADDISISSATSIRGNARRRRKRDRQRWHLDTPGDGARSSSSGQLDRHRRHRHDEAGQRVRGVVASDSNTVGGIGPGEGNVIAFTGGRGLRARPEREPIRGNSIYANGGLGIDLGCRPPFRLRAHERSRRRRLAAERVPELSESLVVGLDRGGTTTSSGRLQQASQDLYTSTSTRPACLDRPRVPPGQDLPRLGAGDDRRQRQRGDRRRPAARLSLPAKR